QLQRAGVHVHDRSRVEDIQAGPRGVTLRTADGATVRAGQAVMATGYAAQQWLRRRVARNRSSYAFVTDPVDRDALGALRRTLLWESARPYLYLRTTADDRLLVGGEDDVVDMPARRDRRVDAKARKLRRKLGRLFPELPLEP